MVGNGSDTPPLSPGMHRKGIRKQGETTGTQSCRKAFLIPAIVFKCDSALFHLRFECDLGLSPFVLVAIRDCYPLVLSVIWDYPIHTLCSGCDWKLFPFRSDSKDTIVGGNISSCWSSYNIRRLRINTQMERHIKNSTLAHR